MRPGKPSATGWRPEHPCLVGTGGPGTGKSALLAHMLLAANRVLGNTVPNNDPYPPTGAFDIGVPAAGMSCDDMVM